MKKYIIFFLISGLLAAAALMNGCGEDLYAVKAMREKQAQVSGSAATERNYDNHYSSIEEKPEAPEVSAKPAAAVSSTSSTGKYRDRFLYENETPLKHEKDLADEKSPADAKTAAPKPNAAIAASGPNEMRRLREIREADEKSAVAAGKPLPRKIERDDVGLTDPINVPKQQNAEAITPPAELLKPIVINGSSATVSSGDIVPSSPKKETASNDERVNAELKKLASKIENKPSVVLPKEEELATKPQASPVVTLAKPAPKDAAVPATGYDWSKLSAAKKEETPVAVKTPVKPEPVKVAETPKKVEPAATPVAIAKPAPVAAPVVKTPAPAPVVAAKPEPVKVAPVVVATKPAEKKTDDWGLPIKEAPKEPVVVEAPKKEEPATVEIKLADSFSQDKVEAAKPKVVEAPLPTTTVKPVNISPVVETPKAPAPVAPVKVAVAAPAPKAEPVKPVVAEVKTAPVPLAVNADDKRKVEIMTKQVQILKKEGNAKEELNVLDKILAIEPDNAWAKGEKANVENRIKSSTPVVAVAEASPVKVAPAAPKPAPVVAAAPRPVPVPAIVFDDAKEKELKAAAERKAKVNALTKQAQSLRVEGKHAQAVQTLDKILAIEPDNMWAQDMKKDSADAIARNVELEKEKAAPKPAVKVAAAEKVVKPAPVVAAAPKPAPAPVAAAPKPATAPVVAAPKPAPKKTVVEPVFGTNEDRTFKGWPGSGMILKSGMDRLLSWMPDTAANFSNLRLMFSSDGGRTWKTVASDMKAGRIAAWTVPVVTSQNCRLKIVGSDDTGEDVTLAISEQFSVNTGVWETVDSAAVK